MSEVAQVMLETSAEIGRARIAWNRGQLLEKPNGSCKVISVVADSLCNLGNEPIDRLT